MKVITLETQIEIDNAFDAVKAFCRDAVRNAENSTTRQNMDYVLWKNNPASLMNRLYIKKSFLMLTLLYDGSELIALSGVEHFSDDTALIGRRLFVLKGHRGKQVFLKYMLDAQLEFIKKLGYRKGLMTVNEYKKRLYDVFKRLSKGGSISLTGKCGRKINIIEKPFILNTVLQYGFFIEV